MTISAYLILTAAAAALRSLTQKNNSVCNVWLRVQATDMQDQEEIIDIYPFNIVLL